MHAREMYTHKGHKATDPFDSKLYLYKKDIKHINRWCLSDSSDIKTGSHPL